MKSTDSFLNKMLSDWPAKLLCVLLALIIVTTLFLAQMDTVSVQIPLTIIMPEGYEAQNKMVNSVKLSIKGDKQLIYLIDYRQIQAIADFSVIPEDTLKTNYEANYPVIVPITLSYPEGLINVKAEVAFSTDPNDIRLLLKK